MLYSETNIDKRILKGLAEMGFVEMTPIQEAAIPRLLAGGDIIGQAQTGTGKTAAFGIPMIENIDAKAGCVQGLVLCPTRELAIQAAEELKKAQTGTGKTAAFGIPMIENIDAKAGCVQGLVLCPTRELAIQAAEELKKMAKYVSGVKIAAIYGGQDIEKQFRILRGKVSIVVGTPGRVMDHLRRGTLDLFGLRMLVLDEADEMLNMGFREDIETICEDLPEERQTALEDIETICEDLPEERQTALFSATMPEEILEITQMYQKDAVHVQAAQEELTVPKIKQSFYVVKGRMKDTSLCRLLDYLSPKRALIFCNTKRKVDELTLLLKGKGYSAEALHGDLSQHQRDRVMTLFRNGKLELLLATDVAARGIDVDDVDMVFNYDMPQDMEYYVHRIGRTGRAGRSGKAVSLITNRERYKIESLEEYCNTRIKEKELPTASSAMTVKAYKNVSEAIEYCRGKDLTPYMKIVYKRCIDDGMDPLEVAAAFLRQTLGEIEQESETVSGSKQKERKEKKGRSRKEEKEAERRDRWEKDGKHQRDDRDEKSGRGKKAKKHKDKGTGKKGKKDGKRAKSNDKNRRYDKRRTGSRKK